MEEEHEKIIEDIIKNIRKINKEIKINSHFKYNRLDKNQEVEIDLLILLNTNLCLFEIKSGAKERNAKKQLFFHKDQLLNSRYKLSLRQKITFSEIKLFRVSGRDNIIENIETNEQITFDPTYLENPLEFLTK